ncbi:hypothetical protein F3Y22_tig00110430pilonHSYRG00025 [Hibiscus syriacus]|uniref:MULE transposase domain-containing protein n=1 Tax=Hibiscus syriacus TaxID=106335 RepID=A0A6A3AK75_HIBSY|nr:hypothetical protein F3Y22_tig00110430pilonHSYRG00025 [Hibiscus syriacus]
MLNYWVKYGFIDIYVEHEVVIPFIVDDMLRIIAAEGAGEGVTEGATEGVVDCAAERVTENVVDAAGLHDIGDVAEQYGLNCDRGGLDDTAAWDGCVQDVATEEESDSEEQSAESMDIPYLSDDEGDDELKYAREKNKGKKHVDEGVDEGGNNGVIEDVGGNDTDYYDSDDHGKHFEDTIRDHPKMKLKEIQRMVQSEIHVNVNLCKCRREKNMVTSRLGGNMKEEFTNLWDYADELRSKNPGSTIKMARDWKEGCMPIIGVDDCFLKGPFKGILLSAVGRDGNDHMYPIAWAVVEGESTYSWSWFLNIVAADLGLDDGFGYTIISDQHKGIEIAVNDVLP